MASARRAFAWALQIFATSFAFLTASLGPGLAAPDWTLVELRKDLETLANTLDQDQVRAMSIFELVQVQSAFDFDISAVETPAFIAPDRPAQLAWTDLRKSLGTLAAAYGGKDNFDVLAVQNADDMQAISVERGVLTLAQLATQMTHRQVTWDHKTGVHRLRTPLIVQAGATLRLGPEDYLELSREDGAYILNFGRVEIFGSVVSGTFDTHHANPEFRPFVTSAGSGSFHIVGATIRDLGFGGTSKFAGLSVVAFPALHMPLPTIIENNRFENLGTLSLVGVTRSSIESNRFFDMRRNPLLVSRSSYAKVSHNLFYGRSPTNAIRITDGSDHARVTGNILLRGARAGVLVNQGSDYATVSGNLIWKRDGGGIKLENTRCAFVEENLILDDKQKGVEIRASYDATVTGNQIVGNHNAGVWVSAQPKGAVSYVVDNLLRENGAGLSTAGGGDLALIGNDFSQQFPRLLDGDVTLQFRSLVTDLKGAEPVLMNAGGTSQAKTLRPAHCQS